MSRYFGHVIIILSHPARPITYSAGLTFGRVSSSVLWQPEIQLTVAKEALIASGRYLAPAKGQICQRVHSL